MMMMGIGFHGSNASIQSCDGLLVHTNLNLRRYVTDLKLQTTEDSFDLSTGHTILTATLGESITKMPEVMSAFTELSVNSVP